MRKNKGYSSHKLSFNRKAVDASASVMRKKNTIHSFTEIDISLPRQLIKEYYEKTGEKLSFTAYIVTCLAKAIEHHPKLNSFIRRGRHYLLDDVIIGVMIERELEGERVPEPMTIREAHKKTHKQITAEIREAQKQQEQKLGSLTKSKWFNLIPGFLLKSFVKIADKNRKMAIKYGKIAVTSAGMFSQEPIWFVPHGSPTVLLTVGSISNKVIEAEGQFESREHLCLTASFDHNIVDGAPAARFMWDLIGKIKSGELVSI